VRNRKSEFCIRTNAKSQREIFDDIRGFILQLNSQNVIGLEEAIQILKDCFGSADAPRSWNEQMIQAVRDLGTKQINLGEFRKAHKLATKRRSPAVIVAAIFIAFIIIVALIAANGR
jgi:hypothetical protein